MKRVFLFFLWMVTLCASAQKPLPNTAIAPGEKIEYELYFNWKFIWLKAGTATFLTQNTRYKEQDALRSYLITRTSKRLDKYFMMRDTLTGIMTHDNVPLYYRKGANESKKYRRDEVWYSYDTGITTISQRYQKPSGKVTTRKHSLKEEVYDMMSLMQRARNMRPEDFRKGEKRFFKMADGDEVEDVYVIYRGKETISLKSNKDRYSCLVYSFVAKDEGKDKEVVRFFITDDANHLPVRLDMFLRFGSAKAFLMSYSGLRNPVTSKRSK